MEFDDFVVRFARSPTGDGLTAVLTEPSYGASGALSGLHLVPDLNETDAFGDLDPVRKVGSALFDTIIRGVIRDAWIETDQRAKALHRGLRFRLLFELDDPLQRSLFQYPWESLHRPDTRDFLALDPRTPVVRSIASRRPSAPRSRPARLRLVAAFASPDSLPELDLELERNRLERFASKGAALTLQIVEEPTLEALTAALDEGGEPPALLFCGHGTFSSTEGAYLCFEDVHGGLRRVEPSTLAECCKSEARPWLVVLNACQSAEVGPHLGAHSSLAAALVLAGLPAVIGMRNPFRDQAAITFSSSLFTSLAAGKDIELAMTRARRALHAADSDSADWTVPILTVTAVTPGHGNDPRTDAMKTSSSISGFTFTSNESVIGVAQGPVHQSFHRHYGGDFVSDESRSRLAARHRELLISIPESVQPEVAVGIDLLIGGRYREGREAFERARRKAGEIARLALFEILCELGGRRFEELEITEAQRLNHLSMAARQRDPDCTCIDFFLAALKIEFYRRHGFIEKPPSPELLLDRFVATPCSDAEKDLLRRHVRLSDPKLGKYLEQRS